MSAKGKTAVIIGGGPAGLTAAYELLTKTDIVPVVLEATSDLGGISKTVNYKGNRMDIGGHRFFSKSDVVMNWWLSVFPVVDTTVDPFAEVKDDKVLLIRNRLSRILFLRKFFDYPISLTLKTIRNLGLWRIIKIGFSYCWSVMFKRKPEKSLEDFFINRFGVELYKTFFKSYTEKVWGVPCSQISPEWGGQRIKGLSVTKTLLHAFKSIFVKSADIQQKNIETSLISRFLYPKYGPGQLWSEVAEKIVAKGGKIIMQHEVVGIDIQDGKIKACTARNHSDESLATFECDYLFSTMPVSDLIKSMGNSVPSEIQRVASGLMYRDFITVGVLLDKVAIRDKGSDNNLKDNWIYIQERDVKVGRIQIFNNWSPYMVADPSKVWIGMEYFCFEGDELWNMTEQQFSDFAISELQKINFANKSDVIDSVVIKVPKTYPCYFGSYDEFDKVIAYVNQFENLFLVGRNGMHKYNNQDHSMLTAIVAVENIINNDTRKDNLWKINLEDDYHEEK
jgi:protoporphyrinogen oxidase